MVKPITPGHRQRYVDESDEGLPEHEHSVFLLRAPTVAEQRWIDDHGSAWENNAAGEARFVSRPGSSLYWPLKIGLCGSERYALPFDGEANTIDRNAPKLVTDAFLDTLPPGVRKRMALAAMKLAGLDETASGESSPPRTPTTGESQGTAPSAGGEAVKA